MYLRANFNAPIRKYCRYCAWFGQQDSRHVACPSQCTPNPYPHHLDPNAESSKSKREIKRERVHRRYAEEINDVAGLIGRVPPFFKRAHIRQKERVERVRFGASGAGGGVEQGSAIKEKRINVVQCAITRANHVCCRRKHPAEPVVCLWVMVCAGLPARLKGAPSNRFARGA